MSEATTISVEAAPEVPPAATPLASLAAVQALVTFAGAQTPSHFLSVQDELLALRHGAGAYDLGWRTRLRMTGSDRVRWLNGMVTNTAKDLPVGQLNYTFLLNAQGRIQGDGDVYALPDALLLSTDCAQVSRLQQHLDRFIIMDDVELTRDEDVTAIGVCGPKSADLLTEAGVLPHDLATGALVEHGQFLVARERIEQYAIWTSPANVLALWERLLAAGATPCGIEAVESLRVLTGVPRYGADIQEKSLAQETGQMRALNFNKGCYLGQEIVERIRSRATVHKALRVFSLEGALPPAGTPLFAPAKPDTAVGELTSITTVAIADLAGVFALGTVRSEAAEAPLDYPGGKATALSQAPLQTA